jgi:segregation and condensation protein A
MMDFKLQQFTGPLDLLLNLVGEQKMNISDVSLSTVTEQYLKYLEKLEEREPEEMADFLLIAARLLLLKSKKLLPMLQPEEDEGPSLEDQLRLYQAFVEASKKLNKRWLSGIRSDFRVEPPRRPSEFVPPKNLSQALLQEFFLKLLQRIKPLPELPQARMDKAVSVRDKIETIRALLQKAESVSFRELLGKASNRSEIIASFLALLELVKSENIVLRQKKTFEDILIEKL